MICFVRMLMRYKMVELRVLIVVAAEHQCVIIPASLLDFLGVFFTLSVCPKVINLSFYKKKKPSTENHTQYYFVHLDLISLFEYFLCTLTIINTQRFKSVAWQIRQIPCLILALSANYVIYTIKILFNERATVTSVNVLIFASDKCILQCSTFVTS